MPPQARRHRPALLLLPEQVRPEHQQADGHRGQGRGEYGKGGHILGPADAGALFQADLVGQQFDGGVQGLHGPDQADGQGECDPFQPGNPANEAKHDHQQGGCGMDPVIVLPAQEHAAAGQGKNKAPEFI